MTAAGPVAWGLEDDGDLFTAGAGPRAREIAESVATRHGYTVVPLYRQRTPEQIADLMASAPDPGGWRVGMHRDDYLLLARHVLGIPKPEEEDAASDEHERAAVPVVSVCGPPAGCTCPAVAWTCICGARRTEKKETPRG